MEKNKFNIEQEVQKTMESIDKIQRVEGNPFLYTRLQERLKQQKEPREVVRPSYFPVWQMATILFLFFINGIVLYQSGFFDTENSIATEEVTIEDFAEEYALTQNEEDLDYLSIND